jgi:hypothetical protein
MTAIALILSIYRDYSSQLSLLDLAQASFLFQLCEVVLAAAVDQRLSIYSSEVFVLGY